MKIKTKTKDFDIMDSKPFFSYAGDESLFKSLESSLAQALPQEPTDWRRSYGRAVKSVYLEASFIPFSQEVLPKEGDWKLIQRPMLHIFWTDCSDIDLYKGQLKENIETWLKTLTQHNIQDWMIILVETYDLKKSNKLLPRTTVLDKIRTDFGSRNADRCVSVINPIKSESRAADSWRSLLTRIRILALDAYNKALLRFEETIREQRERRNEPCWNFCQYFILQEELAFVLEMLGIYDEALVQYDELDALFTQFILNSNFGESPGWLSSFQSSSFDQWRGLVLSQTVNMTQRSAIQRSDITLLPFRSYLFGRQCAMLLLTCKPWEIAQRSLPFLHNCIKELEILETSAPAGATACWIFLCCLEVLHTCERFNDSGQVEAYSLYTAGLWAYARDKLRELGELCGLMPGCEPTSEQLHTVVGLIAGMGDSPGTSKQPTPTDKLKEALSSKDAFRKHYLELAELSMGTYKHVGRIRSARFVGRDLAEFYMSLGETHKAIVFLNEALKTYEAERWDLLALDTHKQLAQCYRSICDNERLIQTCAAIASYSRLTLTERLSYQNEMLEMLSRLKSPEGSTTPLVALLQPLGRVNSLFVRSRREDGKIIRDGPIELTLELESALPGTITIGRLSVTIERRKETETVQVNDSNPNGSLGRASGKTYIKPGNTLVPPSESAPDPAFPANGILNEALSRLTLIQHFDYKQDKSLDSALIISPNPKQFLKRTDSHGRYRKTSVSTRPDISHAFVIENITLTPGKNTYILQTNAKEEGNYCLGQVVVAITDQMELLSGPLLSASKTTWTVITKETSITLSYNPLVAGLIQSLQLMVHAGSETINEKSMLHIRTSRGLTFRSENSSEFCRESDIPVNTAVEPFNFSSLPLEIFAVLPSKRDAAASITHKISVQCSWDADHTSHIELDLQPAMLSSIRLHTAHKIKFIQIQVSGLTTHSLILTNATLRANHNAKLESFNPSGGQPWIIRSGLNVSLMWKLDTSEVDSNTPPIKIDFETDYDELSPPPEYKPLEHVKRYHCAFEINDYRTIFEVVSRVEPMKGSEFCRAGTMCHLQLEVSRASSTISHHSLMYEVLADQTMWAVCGRTAGVVSFETVDRQSVTLDVMPLIGGFLPLPIVRLAKYIPADHKGKDGHPRLEPFSAGQVYNASKSQQVHVLPSTTGD